MVIAILPDSAECTGAADPRTRLASSSNRGVEQQAAAAFRCRDGAGALLDLTLGAICENAVATNLQTEREEGL